jgi:hypothetical protein
VLRAFLRLKARADALANLACGKQGFPDSLERRRSRHASAAIAQPILKGENTMTTTNTLAADNLRHFTGSENWYRHGLVRSVLFTDGAKYVADAGGAYWLLDEIALAQRYEKAVAAEEFQLWKLAVNLDQNTGILTCDDGNGNIVCTKRIPFTDFPLEEFSLYFCNNTILLPSEY